MKADAFFESNHAYAFYKPPFGAHTRVLRRQVASTCNDRDEANHIAVCVRLLRDGICGYTTTAHAFGFQNVYALGQSHGRLGFAITAGSCVPSS
jgi:hypothetical protein